MPSNLSERDMYSKIPLSVGDNRDENIIIDVLGNWIPECDLLFYGLLNSEYSEKLFKLKNCNRFDPHEIYLSHCYFSGDDLIRYLASTDDNLIDMSEDILNDATNLALSKYFYVPCNETMLRHSIIELLYYDWVKSVTLIYPWDIREIDIQYLTQIIPQSVLKKVKIANGNIPDYLLTQTNTSFKYTTIILNSIAELNLLIDDNKKYNTDTSFFLLRNSSENVKFRFRMGDNGKKDIEFEEIGTSEILNKLIDKTTLMPKTQMRFARYEPLLFKDARPDPKEFMIGR